MIFQIWMGLRKSRCDVLNGTPWGWVCPTIGFIIIKLVGAISITCKFASFLVAIKFVNTLWNKVTNFAKPIKALCFHGLFGSKFTYLLVVLIYITTFVVALSSIPSLNDGLGIHTFGGILMWTCTMLYISPIIVNI